MTPPKTLSIVAQNCGFYRNVVLFRFIRTGLDAILCSIKRRRGVVSITPQVQIKLPASGSSASGVIIFLFTIIQARAKIASRFIPPLEPNPRSSARQQRQPLNYGRWAQRLIFFAASAGGEMRYFKRQLWVAQVQHLFPELC